MKVYVVTHGSYSDYSVDAVTLDKKVAQAVVARMKSDIWHENAQVETYTLLDKDSSLEPITDYRVEVNPDGSERRRWTSQHHPWEDDPQETWGNNTYSAASSTRGFEVALKAARDKAYKQQARKAGVADP